MAYCPYSKIPNLSYILVIIVIGFLLSSPTISYTSHKISIYPLQDEYFDRIYVIQKDNQRYYMKIYCKQSNMLSVSITQQLEFQEAPRFPIHPEWRQTPKFQKKLYTFLQNCHAEISININGNVIQIRRNDPKFPNPIFIIKDYKIISKNHIEIQTQDHSIKWGMGERFQNNFNIVDGVWAVWNRDRPWQIDAGSPGKSGQTYGHQPVYLARQIQNLNKFHLVYFKNTHGFNYFATNGAKNLKYMVTGGKIHFVIILGDKPQSILQQYHLYIGNGHVPPFWSLGYHQCRWGYKNIGEVENVVSQFQRNKLPLDIVWSDLDYMHKKAIFTIDESSYPPNRVRSLLKDKQLHYVPLIDVGVSLADTVAIEQGKKMNVFLHAVDTAANSRQTRSTNNQPNYIGVVWPGKVHFVDYLHPNSSKFWQGQLNRLYQDLPFSGVWLDMNQPSNFQGNQYVVQSFKIQHQETINMMTIDVNLKHYTQNKTSYLKKMTGQDDYEQLGHLQVHAYYGHLSTVPTHNFLKRHGRPFIISRSNSVGSGAYAGHWTGDNVATWDFLRLSISGNFLFQIFGIQMVGADICGFRGNTNKQLCGRWLQVGSMYPFARNHNQNQSMSQQPYHFGDQVIQTTRLSFGQRYSLLKQMYSTMVIVNGTGSYYRPLLFEFPEDQECYTPAYSETEFLIGDYLLGAPIVEKGRNQRQVYFPGSDNQMWYQLFYSTELGFNTQKSVFYHGGMKRIIQNTMPAPPITFLRGGRLVFTNKFQTRTSHLNSQFTIIAALNNDKTASGHFLALQDFNNQLRLSQCVNLNCAIFFNIMKQNQSSMIIEWLYEGKADITHGMFNFTKIRILDQTNIYQSKQNIAFRLDKPEGKNTFTVVKKL